MKLVTYNKNKKTNLGIKLQEGILPVNLTDQNAPKTIHDVINQGESAINFLNQLIEESSKENYITEKVEYAPALTCPEKIICVGLNYKKHADEIKADYPKHPILFNKFNNTLSGHNTTVKIPETTERVDYEAELGIVIGKEAHAVTEEEALDYVFGYCTTNDLSARDLQKRTGQWMLGKTSDGFLPIGPYVVTKEEVPNPDDLKIQTKLNGNIVQDSNTSDMIFSVPELISYISQHMTLKPGDLIITGTPEGVIIGQPIEERNYLTPADEVIVEIENLGSLTTKFKKWMYNNYKIIWFY